MATLEHPPATPEATIQGGEDTAGHGQTPKQQILSAGAYRLRHQMPPWIVLAILPFLGLITYLLPWVPTFAKMLAELVIGALIGWWQHSKRARGTHRVYALSCVAGATVWMLYTTRLGVWSGLGRFSLLMLLLGWLPAAWIWWDYHRVRPSNIDDTPAAELPPTDPVVAAWAAKVGNSKGPLPHSHLSCPEDVLSGMAYRLQLKAGDTIEDAEEVKRRIAGRLGISRTRILFEALPGDGPGDTGNESVIRIIISEPQNAQHEERPWQGPTHNPANGTYSHGVYPDGSPAEARLYLTENGKPIRACNSLHSGAVGSGKSRGVALKALEHLETGFFVIWFADGQGGVSIPELMDPEITDWPCASRDERMRMLRGAYKLMLARAQKQKQRVWVDSRGNRRVGLGHWEATPEDPFIQIILDEAHEDLRDPAAVKIVKAINRMSNKVGMGVDLLTQVPLVNELGGASGDGGAAVLRAMAKAGNVYVYRAEEGTTGMVAISSKIQVDPQTLPNVPGLCYLAGHTLKPSPVRTYYVSEDNLYDWLRRAPKARLDDFSATAAGEDYATRHQRIQGSTDAVLELDLDELDTELAVLLGERLPGQDAPGQAAAKLTIKQAVYEVVKAAGGPIKRDQITTDLAAMGVQASKSAVDKALSWWCELSHMHKPEERHGFYDLMNREGEESIATSQL